MKRIIIMALGVLMGLVVAAPTVLAQEGPPNGGAPEVVSGTIIVNPGDPNWPGTCTFPLQLDLSGKAKTIELPDARFILTSPGLDVTVTNLDNGEQATFNITGSIHGTPRPDDNDIVDYVITGRNLAFDPAGVFLNIGRFTYTLDESDPANPKIVKPQEGKGQAIDVCALLS